MNEIVREHWDRMADKYDDFYKLSMGIPHKVLEGKIGRILGEVKEGDSVVEFGCGTGLLTMELAKKAKKVTALDLSRKMLSMAASRMGTTSSGDRVEFRWGDVQGTGLPGKKYDAVVGLYVLQYTDVRKALGEAVRLLKPGGKVAFIEPYYWNPFVWLLCNSGIARKVFQRPVAMKQPIRDLARVRKLGIPLEDLKVQRFGKMGSVLITGRKAEVVAEPVTVCIAGYFDPIHEGHLDHIQAAKALGDKLVVIAGTEAQCDRKHQKHFHSWEGKVRLLKALGADEVVPNVDTDGSCAETIRGIRPQIFAKGAECTLDNIPKIEVDTCREVRCKIVVGVGQRLNRSSAFWGSSKPE